MSRSVLIVDACSAINVLATRNWAEIFAAGNWLPVLPRQVAAETLCIYDEDGESEDVDLASMRDAGLLEIWDLVDEEVVAMVRHAVRLGPGEAAALAIARARGLALATDDRPALRVAAQAPAVRVVSTADLMHAWARDRARTEAHRALRAITRTAAFRPPASDRFATWWSDMLDDHL